MANDTTSLARILAECETILSQCLIAANEASAAAAAVAIANPAPIDSPHFTGVPTGPTAAIGTNTTQLATTEYLDRLVGASNGLATLNSMGQVPASQLSSSTLNYKGTWNATTNSPTITSGVGTNGDFYQVAVAGTTSIDGISSWAVGDEIVFNGTAWQKVPIAAFVSTNIPLTGLAAQAAFTVVMNNTAGSASPTAVTMANLATALGLATTYATLASPAFTGAPTAPTPSPGDNTTKVATTAFVSAALGGGFAPLDSPVFTGTPTTPTATVDTNSSAIASCAFVIGQAASATPLVDGTAAVGTSTRYARADHVHPTDSSRAPLNSPTLTGTPAAPTPGTNVNTTQIPTCAWVNTYFLTQATAASTYAPQASPTFTGTPAGPTAAPGTNTTQLATCAFVTTAVAGITITAGSGISVSGSTVSVDTSQAFAVGQYSILIVGGGGTVVGGATIASGGSTAIAYSSIGNTIGGAVPGGQVWRNMCNQNMTTTNACLCLRVS